MSFLNSVLSTINKDSSAQAIRPAAPSVKPKSQQNASGQPPGTARPVVTGGQGTLKRKAEPEGSLSSLKIPKTSSGPSSIITPSRSSTSSPAARSAGGLSKPPEPYKGTSRPTAQTNGVQKQGAVKAVQKPAAAATTPSTSAPAPAKKGYLATLERARMAQEANKGKGVGEIRHIKVEKKHLSRREKERLAAEAKAAQKDPKLKGTLQSAGRSRDGTPVTANGKVVDPKKKVDTGYKGTMRPAAAATAPAYKGTMRPGGAPKAAPPPKRPRPGEQSRYKYAEDYSDEEEDDEEDDGYDSASSDMEAGLNEIDQEELISAKVARREDEEALREEEELKRQKLERKRKLQALSAAAAKKKKVY
ncbi:hypothetical protein KVT40_004328 [Elsinoe batatas]|uniref:SPT2 chromatin protein n=1 Tax=Elsinoe batatas TaxID=2601811 RepID=A0A8K0PDU3_9PEZI|nr:hypothetical protein KVT40_004328 [Elsinoe batatas]